MIVDSWHGVTGSHYLGMTVLVPPSELGNYLFKEIRKLPLWQDDNFRKREARRLLEIIEDSHFDDREKENLVLNVRNFMDERPTNEEARPEGRASP